MWGLQEMQLWSLGQEDPLEEGMAAHSSILAWRIPWTEEPDGRQSTGSQRARHDWNNLACMHAKHFSPIYPATPSFHYSCLYSNIVSLALRILFSTWQGHCVSHSLPHPQGPAYCRLSICNYWGYTWMSPNIELSRRNWGNTTESFVLVDWEG